MRTCNILATSVAATAAVLTIGTSAANAATLNTDGSGFVGKGEVQSAFGWANAKMQDNHTSITFSTKQGAEQALSSTAHQTATQGGTQSASQTGTLVYSQTATQDVTETLSCFKNGAAVQNVRHGVREATRTSTVTDTVTDTRTVTRSGDRTGSRNGTRAGTLAGSLNADLLVENRKNGQYVGWNLKGYVKGDPKFGATGANQWGDASFANTPWADTDFGAWSFEGEDFVFPEYDFAGPDFPEFDLTGVPTFGAWDTDNTNADPDVCVNNGNGITDFKRVVHEDPAVVGGVTEALSEDAPVVDLPVPSVDVDADLPTFGGTVYGDVASTGPASLFATFSGTTKPLTISVPAL